MMVDFDTFLDDFIYGYLECAVWASTDSPPNDREGEPQPLDDLGYTAEDIYLDTLTAMQRDCEEFVKAEWKLLARLPEGYDNRSSWSVAELAGHDFWLTRNRHGAGFWDRGLGELGQRLTEACTPYGEAHLLIDDNGELFYTG